MAFLTKKKHDNTQKGKKKASPKTSADIIPICDLVKSERDNTKHFITKDGVHVDIYRVNTFDLNSLSKTDTEMMIATWTRFHQAYSDDLKLISMNFPTDTSKQQAYFRKKLSKCKNLIHEPFLQDKLDELEYVEKHGVDRYYYLMTFAENSEDYEYNDNIIRGRLVSEHLVSKIDLHEKIAVLSKLAEKSVMGERAEKYFCESVSEEEQKKAVEKRGYNPYLIRDIQPNGNINFGVERFWRTGSGYETCISIYRFPSIVGLYWLLQTMSLDKAVATLDIHTQDQAETKKNLNEAIKENRKRFNTETDLTAQDEAAQKMEVLRDYYEEINQQGYVSKEITLRIFLYAPTYQAMDELAASRLEKVTSDSYKAAIFVNEAKAEWQSQFMSYTQQQKTIYGRKGQPCLTKTIAKGLPFYFTNIDDSEGSFLGTTNSNQGAALFDMYSKSSGRLSYNALMIGTMGSGKSSTLKKLVLDNAIRGNYIRIIDPSGEYRALTEALGGTVISLDGSNGMLNALEILRTNDEAEGICWQNHVAKLATCYSLITPHADTAEIAELQMIMYEFYVDYGLIDPEKDLNEQELTNKPSDEYPTWGDFVKFLYRYIKKMEDDRRSDVEREMTLLRVKRLESIRLHIDNLIRNCGEIVEGHTSIDGAIFDSPVISFDTTTLTNVRPEVFDLQIFLAIQLCWDNCLTVGSRMKYLYDSHQIDWDDITRFAIVIDESHRILNASKPSVVEQVLAIQRQARKYFGGVMLASQNLRDFVPEGSSEQVINQIKLLFEFSEYKFLLRQDGNIVEMAKSVFPMLTDQDIKDMISLEMGQAILCLGSKRKVQLSIQLTQNEIELFKGGA